jgi:uncharacterized membrane protein (UPF0127 family)
MGKFGTALGFILWAGAVQAGCSQDTVELRTDSGTVMRFSVEVADTDAERAQGLMHREGLPKSSGMLFVYPTPRVATFWMKNTLIPLDMIFADATGLVTHVHSDAVPLDESTINGGPDVTYVLEINGGMAAALGLRPGAVLRADVVDPSIAAWACDGA